MTLLELQNLVLASGYRVSGSSCDIGGIAYACSVESRGEGMWTMPVFVACFDGRTGWLTVTGQPDKLLARTL